MSRRFEIIAAAVAVAGLALFLLSAAHDPRVGLQGWLAASLAWTTVSLGCLLVALMRVLVGTGLQAGLGPALAAASGTLPLVGLAFIPVLLGVTSIYPWTLAPPDSSFQRFWLKADFFAWRSVAYFVLWVLFAALALRLRRRAVGGAGVVVVAITGSLAAVDWMMSLEPGFHSSIYGMLYLAHAALVGWALAAAATMASGRPASAPMAAGYLIGGIALWAYLSFCQYLVVWNGNEPLEIRWYLLRESPGWGLVFWAASFLEGILPFLFLLPARMRASRTGVAMVSGALVIGGLLETAVLVLPDFGADMRPGLPALPAAVGLGGLWLLVFARRLRRPTAFAMEAEHG